MIPRVKAADWVAVARIGPFVRVHALHLEHARSAARIGRAQTVRDPELNRVRAPFGTPERAMRVIQGLHQDRSAAVAGFE